MKSLWNNLKQQMNAPLTWIGHRYIAAMGIVMAYSAAGAIADHWMKFPGEVYWPMFAVLCVGFVIVVQGGNRHDYGLCPKCYKVMPLNPGELAEGKYRNTLKREHWLMDRPKSFSLVFLAVIFISAYLSKFAPFAVSQFFFLVYAVAAQSMSYHRIIHQRYYPWCPYCRHGDGDLEIERVPDPSGVSR